MATMHANETPTDVELARRLLANEFPEWAGRPIACVRSSGTVNALYRLGDDMVVRLRRTARWGIGAVDRDLRWLPQLAPLLPIAIPVPLAKGAPAHGYPWEWGVYPWLDGEHPVAGEQADLLARDLARLVRALGAIDVKEGAPAAGRGSSLRRFDEPTRAALEELRGTVDTDAAGAAWDEALGALEWPDPLVWTHGDLMPGNLLVRDSTLTGVIDWELMGLGDPACDLAVAWNLLSTSGRQVFREELGVDDETWARGRGWALWTGLVALPYYEETNPELADNARYRIGEVLADYEASAR